MTKFVLWFASILCILRIKKCPNHSLPVCTPCKKSTNIFVTLRKELKETLIAESFSAKYGIHKLVFLLDWAIEILLFFLKEKLSKLLHADWNYSNLKWTCINKFLSMSSIQILRSTHHFVPLFLLRLYYLVSHCVWVSFKSACAGCAIEAHALVAFWTLEATYKRFSGTTLCDHHKPNWMLTYRLNYKAPAYWTELL